MKTRKNKYNVDEVVSQLYKKHDCKVDKNTKTVLMLNGKSKNQPKKDDLGNASHGKIDFLVNHCGFKKVIVAEF